MSTLRNLTRSYKKGLFYFYYDKSFVVMSTKNIVEEVYQKGDVIQAKCNEERPMKAKIIELSDDETLLRKLWRESDMENDEQEAESILVDKKEKVTEETKTKKRKTDGSETQTASKRSKDEFKAIKKNKQKPVKSNLNMKSKAVPKMKTVIQKNMATVCCRGTSKDGAIPLPELRKKIELLKKQNRVESSDDEESDTNSIKSNNCNENQAEESMDFDIEIRNDRSLNDLQFNSAPISNDISFNQETTREMLSSTKTDDAEIISKMQDDIKIIISRQERQEERQERLLKNQEKILEFQEQMKEMFTGLTSATRIAKPGPFLSYTFSENLPEGVDRLTPVQLYEIKERSKSVANFALNVARLMFTAEERQNSNCGGTKGKNKLKTEKIDLIKTYVFEFFPIPPSTQTIIWKRCIAAINEGCRRKSSVEVDLSSLSNFR